MQSWVFYPHATRDCSTYQFPLVTFRLYTALWKLEFHNRRSVSQSSDQPEKANFHKTLGEDLSPPKYLETRHIKLSSDSPHQQQNDQNQKDQSNSTTGIVSPVLTVRPGGQCANEDEHQNNDQYRTHVFSPFPLFESLVS